MDSESIRKKWDKRYRETHTNADSVAEVLKQNRHLLPTEGKALDLACGLGGNALFLAGKGLEVHAWDISPVAVEKLNATAQQQNLTLHTQTRDVANQPPKANSFDVIIVSRFLERKICPDITAALKPGGLLFYQTYTQEKEGSDGPSNPHFLLEKGELLRLFTGLEVLLYQDRSEAQFIARKG
jgi:2-polyprenyl-3-methyl-5-hydroxy-6-metoxy-1,4-benzoquinol methylase